MMRYYKRDDDWRNVMRETSVVRLYCGAQPWRHAPADGLYIGMHARCSSSAATDA